MKQQEHEFQVSEMQRAAETLKHELEMIKVEKEAEMEGLLRENRELKAKLKEKDHAMTA